MDIIPATIKSYTLVLPQHYLCQYIASEEEIHRKDSTYLKEYINPANIEKRNSRTPPPHTPPTRSSEAIRWVRSPAVTEPLRHKS